MLVNKIDLVSEQQVQEVVGAVREIAPDAPIIQTQFVDFALDRLDAIRRPGADEHELPGEGRPDPVASLTLEASGSFTPQRWTRFMAQLPADRLRLKGFLTLEGRAYHLDATTDTYSLTPTDKVPAQTNRLVVIGQHLDPQQTTASFQQALAANG